MKELSKSRGSEAMKTENMEKSAEPDLDGLIDSSEEQLTSSSNSGVESIARNGVDFTRDKCIKIIKRCRKALKDAQVYERIDAFMKYLLANPSLFIGFTIVTAILIVPVLLFSIFAIINVAVAFTGFIIIEVVILLIGLTVLSCILFFMVSSVMLTGIFFIVFAYVIYCLYKLVKQRL